MVSTTLNGIICEWDLLSADVKNKVLNPGGAVWGSKVSGKFIVLGG